MAICRFPRPQPFSSLETGNEKLRKKATPCVHHPSRLQPGSDFSPGVYARAIACAQNPIAEPQLQPRRGFPCQPGVSTSGRSNAATNSRWSSRPNIIPTPPTNPYRSSSRVQSFAITDEKPATEGQLFRLRAFAPPRLRASSAPRLRASASAPHPASDVCYTCQPNAAEWPFSGSPMFLPSVCAGCCE